METAGIGPTLAFAEQIDQSFRARPLDGQLHFLRLLIEVVNHDDCVASPIETESEDVRRSRVQDFPSAPPDLGTLFAQADDPHHPSKERRRIAFLGLDVDVLKAIRTMVDDGMNQFGCGRETGARIVGPLHRRPNGVALREIEVLTDPDLVSVSEDRRAWK